MHKGSEMVQSQIETERLVLRKFEISDAKHVQALAGNRQVSSTTANIPFPYPDGLAEKWISNQPGNYASKTVATYAITLKETGTLMGCVSMLNLNSDKPELGYWLGIEYWGNGYCTEACKALIDFCVVNFGIKAVYGKCLSRNYASGKVMEKCGLIHIETSTGKDGFMEEAEEFNVYGKVCA